MSDRPFLVELHCHTASSHDGLMTLASLVAAARAVGLDAVAITDHDTVEGALEFRRRAREQGESLAIIVGEEKTLDDGSHFIGLFLERPIESGDLAGAVAEIAGQGGICLVPHPFRRKDGLLRNGLGPLRVLEGCGAAFELFSAKCSAAENARAAELLGGAGLVPFGGSDAHYESDLGECVNEVPRAGDVEASVRAMLAGRTPYRILGKPQAAGAAERSYAPLYYRVKRFVALPKLLVPAARQAYRRYRNLRLGVGPKPLRELYRHA
ncbi:MAG: hypothetical protein RJA22_2446 [Verrucomicrobiota bacterium]